MRGSDRSAWNPAIERVLDRGFAALAFDFRGHGESGGDADLGKIDLDLEAAVAYARQRGYERLFVVGASMGGTAALAVAARQELAGVVVISSPETFEGIDARSALPSVREPLLFIVANGDQPYRRAVEAMHEAAGAGGLVLLPGNEHGTDLLQDRRTRDEALGAIVAFLGAP
jgi:alpha-beta hydrolase superfamily lysophospholipase